MKGDPLPEQDNVVRYVGGSKIDGDVVVPEGFMDPKPSVNWLECAKGTFEEQLDRVRDRVRMKLRPTARFAQLTVGAIRGLSRGVDVVEDPLAQTAEHPAAPCHAEIVGIKDELVYAALAESVIALHKAQKSN